MAYTIYAYITTEASEHAIANPATFFMIADFLEPSYQRAPIEDPDRGKCVLVWIKPRGSVELEAVFFAELAALHKQENSYVLEVLTYDWVNEKPLADKLQMHGFSQLLPLVKANY
jgi:hypothetical protein